MRVTLSIRQFGLQGSNSVLLMIKFTAPDMAEAQEALIHIYSMSNNYEVY